ncbi:MAG: tetratricopeptide repeat protein [Marinoscillum sp.]
MKSSITILFYFISTLVFSQSGANQYYEEALKAYRRRSLTTADQAINQAINLKPNAKSYYLSGLIYEAMEKDLRAVSAFEAAVKLDPEYNEAIFQKALIYLNYGDPEQAFKDFNILLSKDEVPQTRGIYFESDPTGEKSTKVMSMANMKSRLYHYRAQALTRLQRYNEALDDYNDAIGLDTLADYYVSRGLLHVKMSNDPDAIRDFEWAIVLEPQNQLAWYNLALLKPSIDLPDDLLAEMSFGPTLGLLASRAMDDGKYDEARRYFDQSIKNDPKDPLTYVNRGRTLVKLNMFAEARNDFNQARALDPTRFECLYLTGNTYFLEQDYESSIAFYNQYLTVDPKNAMVWYNAAISYLELDNPMEACHYLNKAQSLGMLQADEVIDKHCR